MRDSLKKLVEELGGTVVLDGALIMFSEESFEKAFRHIFEAGMAHFVQTDSESESSGDIDGRH